MLSFDSSLLHPLLLLGLLGLLYGAGVAIYNLYFSPIAKFPGPKIAAVSFWYEFYYDVLLGGKYIFKIKQMHDQFGPVVRINPRELHFDDPSYIDEIYSGPGRRRDKWEWYTRQVGVPSSILMTNPHDLHRVRRAAMSPFFSKQSVRSLQPVIDVKIDQLLERMEGFRKSGGVLTLNHMFAAYGNDVVSEYAFARSENRLARPDFDVKFHDDVIVGVTGGHLVKHWNWILTTLQSIPEAIATKIVPQFEMLISEKKAATDLVKEVMSTPESTFISLNHRTIFHELLSSKLPEHEKSLSRLTDDAVITIAAGTITTSWTLCIAMYYLMTNPAILRKLREELINAIPDPTAHTPLATIENLPYLAAVIQETLRVSYGCTSRLSRLAPDEVLTYTTPITPATPTAKTYQIPKNTPLSLSTVILYHREDIFPDSYAFKPERWIENPRLDRYMISLSRGTRQCIGINLANAEMALLLAKIWRIYGTEETKVPGDRGTLRLYETGERDVKLVGDFNIPGVDPTSKGIRIVVGEP
ncbi:cytochrome P450 [Xylogone sp. PMI_703]|nr:cytochrome P450 [Xylogone sp. PMI_703]